MTPKLKIKNFKEAYRFNLATDTLCALCTNSISCHECAVRELRSQNEPAEPKRGIATMDCCSMQPPEHDPATLERYQTALGKIEDKGRLSLLELPERDKARLRAETDLDRKTAMLEEIAVRQ